MIKNHTSYFWIFLLLCCSLNLFAQKDRIFWTKTTKENNSKKELRIRKTNPKKAQYYNLNIDALKDYLRDAPQRKSKVNISPKFVDFPTAHGSFETFSVFEASILEKPLQDKYPSIKTYAGKSILNPSNTIRFSITTQGLHSMSFNNTYGTQFIDPYTKDLDSYIIYYKKDLPVLDNLWICEFDDTTVENIQQRNAANASYSNANDGIMRDFRLALACTVEYAEFHWTAAGLSTTATESSKKAAVLAAMVVTINRNNFIYERDLSVTMTIVANNESIIFINSDNFTNSNAGALINQSQTVIDANIGFANYDIGHTFSTGGGGLAQLNSPCTGSKARGITGLNSPVGDSFDVDYVAHELGHQFGAPHTFNGNSGGCNGNRTGSNAYEPGSGTTIMAYAGLCAPQNVQSTSDAYFHQKSLQMMWNNIVNGNSTCATQTPSGNTAPTSNAGNDYIIPASTPYKLTGTSTDSDGITTHTYTWEQYDLGQAGVPQETNDSGPLVRSFEGTNNTTRYIPRISDIISNGGVSTEWEKLASVNRNLNFKLTVRDNDSNGGQTATDQMTATVVSSAGPFVVTSQNGNDQFWTVGSTETITWEVAGTTTNGINEDNVDILFSRDGLRYNTFLATNVPNDGSHDITVPDFISDTCRIMVAASNNIFFNINTQNIAISSEEGSCNTYASEVELNLDIPDGAGPNEFGDYLFQTIEVTEDVIISDVDFNIDISHNWLGDLNIILVHPDGTQIILLDEEYCSNENDLDITFDDEATTDVVCSSPSVGIYKPTGTPLSDLDGKSSLGTWTVGIRDYYNVDAGVLNDFSLTLCTNQNSLGTPNIELDLIKLYPNPVEDILFIDTIREDLSYTLFDLNGREILNTSKKVIPMGSLSNGVYMIKISVQNQSIYKRVVKK
ncbi:MAG: hypothetical protein CMC77_05045 [Flavobacteriaceae bacterium]|nr:hypothetical protein [Flavobacteriaceae bacterium]|tara:strand:+ start:2513 stop:5215 length:2703 start_codon:yes stop_codon:yes gene_type:complete